VNDYGKMTINALQIMHCMWYYSNLEFSFNPKTKLKKGIIFYQKTNGITCVTKHVHANHLENFINIWKIILE
jgi:hypothetical protein